MATKLTLTANSSEDANGSAAIYVSETFDEAMDKLYPITNPSSTLEGRILYTWTKVNGNRALIHPSMIGWIEENCEPDE